MGKKLVKLALAASIVLAWAFTSCSDDKGGWLSCKEVSALGNKCYNKYESEADACNDDACWDAVDAKIEQCVIKDACNGTSMSKCGEHYAKECGWEEEED